MVGGGVIERRGGNYRDAMLRPWARGCAVLMIVAGVTMVAHAVFIRTLPDHVIEDVAIAGYKAARDIALREANVQLEPGSNLDPLKLVGLKTDAQIEQEFAARHPEKIDAIRDDFRTQFWVKGIGGLLITLCGWLVIKRRFEEASWVAWALSIAGVVAVWGLFVGFELNRAAVKYFENTPLKVVEFLGIVNVPLAVLISFAFAWLPKRLWTEPK